jgi:hypothetical protein
MDPNKLTLEKILSPSRINELMGAMGWIGIKPKSLFVLS